MGKETNYLKISIITPNYNGAEYLEETIQSILSQNYPNLEYIIIDGGSTDNSIDIIKKYESKLAFWVSEEDNGLYDALQKGFSKTTGDIMAWLNSDDMYHPQSLFMINELFQLPDVKWIEGKQSIYDESGRTVAVYNSRHWSKLDFWMGNYKWIQQESTFWHRELWEKSGAYIDTSLKLAGDMELWNRFFKYEKMYPTQALLAGFRLRSKNQLSLDFIDDYCLEAETILKTNKHEQVILNKVKQIKRLNKYLYYLNKSRVLDIFPITNRIKIAIEKILDRSTIIKFDRLEQKFKL